jgi:uncharacterized membrane protein
MVTLKARLKRGGSFEQEFQSCLTCAMNILGPSRLRGECHMASSGNLVADIITERPADASAIARGRIVSIDVLRGLVMALMALDHTRYYFSGAHVSPEDMDATNLPLFLTRWVTHLCAPVFFFLTGVSIYLASGRLRANCSGAKLVALRGVWLIVLELTVIGFAWSFNPGHSVAGVIWSLGWAMLFVALLSKFPPIVAVLVGTTMILGHNLLDGIHATDLGRIGWIWNLLHQPWVAPLPWGVEWVVLFPLIPWIGVAALGYGVACVFARPPSERRRLFALSGALALITFVVLRVTNAYGNPTTPSINGAMGHFHVPASAGWDHILIGLLNVEKYPPSLLYLLMTLGLGALILAWYQRFDAGAPLGRVHAVMHIFGLVPFAFYVLHLFLIHGLALLVALATGQASAWLAWGGTFPAETPPHYGYGLPVVYLICIGVLGVLYVLCRKVATFKARSRSWWLLFA